MDAVFSALADPARRALLDHLFTTNGQTLGQLCRHLTMTRQGASKHLHLLHQANLIVHVWDGRKKLHYLNPVPLKEVSDHWLAKYPGRIPLASQELENALEASADANRPGA